MRETRDSHKSPGTQANTPVICHDKAPGHSYGYICIGPSHVPLQAFCQTWANLRRAAASPCPFRSATSMRVVRACQDPVPTFAGLTAGESAVCSRAPAM
eukprot:366243-Chlamydomonas_euryale.AAC.9